MDNLPGTNFTNQWMTNPYMFESDQLSNQFSNFNNQALPYPPTYNTGPAGGPVNAATGQPIQSFLDWQKANPGGTTINNTPAQPQAPNPSQWAINNAMISGMQPGQRGGVQGNGMGAYQGQDIGAIMNARGLNNQAYYGASAFPDGRALSGVGPTGIPGNTSSSNPFTPWQPGGGAQGQGGAGGAGGAGGGSTGAGGSPNNWMAALNALANPGKVTTPGATAPLAQGSQPSGGVNQAWLQGVGANAGNQNFVNALRNIQNR